MSTENAIVRAAPVALAESHELSANDILLQIKKIMEIKTAVMIKDEHFGIIPGTKKETLYKSGAEKLALVFRFASQYHITKTELQNGHREYEVKCTLTHVVSGNVVGEGVGSCSTLETKYRWRGGARLCPQCGKSAIIKGKAEYGGGWLCFAKKDGCGAKFKDDDQSIIGQSLERVENPDIADQYNTVLKMAKKRAYVDAVITATGGSDIFTQDMEDFVGVNYDGGMQDAVVVESRGSSKKSDAIPGYEDYNVPASAYEQEEQHSAPALPQAPPAAQLNFYQPELKSGWTSNWKSEREKAPFKNGKNANVAWSKLPGNTLQWVAECADSEKGKALSVYFKERAVWELRYRLYEVFRVAASKSPEAQAKYNAIMEKSGGGVPDDQIYAAILSLKPKEPKEEKKAEPTNTEEFAF